MKIWTKHRALLLALLLVPIHVQGQAPCEGCLDLRLVVELESADAPVVPSLQQSVLRTPAGNYVLSYHFAEPAVAVYDSSGTFLRVYDREGSGPGELRTYPRLFAGPSGEIYVKEGNNRLHRFDAELGHISTRQLERRIWASAAVLPGDRIVVDHRGSEVQNTPETVTIVDSGGAIESTVETVPEEVHRKRIAPARDAGFWTLTVNDNDLRKYDSDGALEQAIQIEGSVVEPWTGELEGEGRQVPYRARYDTFKDVGDGNVLLVAWVSPEDWEPSEGDRPVAIVPSGTDANEMYDTVIEWVDAASGRVLATRRVPYALARVEGNDRLLHSRHPDPDTGHVTTRVWQVSFEGR